MRPEFKFDDRKKLSHQEVVEMIYEAIMHEDAQEKAQQKAEQNAQSTDKHA